jgi:HSP20 family molecular chaperone IbpA
MSRPIPAIDPRGIRHERTGFIRTDAVQMPPSDQPSEGEDPGITLWAGPKALFINAVFPGMDLNGLQIIVTGTQLVFSGPLISAMIKKTGPRRAKRTPIVFSHSVALPYRVDADRVEVRKENGLISIILKRDESQTRNVNACLNRAS